MLTTTKQITLSGESTIGGIVAESYQATIDTQNADDMTIASQQVDKTAYRDNRETCRADRAAFEEMAYTLQNQVS